MGAGWSLTPGSRLAAYAGDSHFDGVSLAPDIDAGVGMEHTSECAEPLALASLLGELLVRLDTIEASLSIILQTLAGISAQIERNMR